MPRTGPGGALVRHLLPAPARARRPGRARVRERVRQRAEPAAPSRPARAALPCHCSPWARRRSTSPSRASAPPKRSRARRRGRPRRRRPTASADAPAGHPQPPPRASVVRPRGRGRWVAAGARRAVQGGGAGAGFWPHVAAQMEVERLANFQVECVGKIASRFRTPAAADFVTPSEYAIGVFLAEEAVPKSRQGAKLPQRDRRVFLRASVYQKELLLAASTASTGAGGVGHSRPAAQSPWMSRARAKPHARVRTSGVDDDSVLADVLGSMELAVGQHGTAWNHVYIHMVGTGADDAPRGNRRGVFIGVRRLDDLRRLKVSCVEVRVGNWGEVVALNTSGLKFTMRTTAYGGVSALRRDPQGPVPVLDTIQRKRGLARTSLASTFPGFSQTRWRWTTPAAPPAAAGGVSNNRISEVPGRARARPRLGSLVETQRPAGMNDVGMVCWRARAGHGRVPARRPRDRPSRKRHHAHVRSAFSPKEDAVYRAAVRPGRRGGLPARTSPPTRARASAWTRRSRRRSGSRGWTPKPAPGVQVPVPLRGRLRDARRRRARARRPRGVEDGEVRWRLTDVCGGQGVECLQGSGEIAAATSPRAYAKQSRWRTSRRACRHRRVPVRGRASA